MKTIESNVNEFRKYLESEAPGYSITLAPAQLDGLSEYYKLLKVWNARLHLVAPTSARNFAMRHILESLSLLEHLPAGARVADIGSGAGLPIIPCLILRPDIRAVLIEASKKKGIFLREALGTTTTKAVIVADRFEHTTPPQVEFVTSRALERFESMLPRLIEWAPSGCKLLLFGGKQLQTQIEALGFPSTSVLLPNSNQRFLFHISKP